MTDDEICQAAWQRHFALGWDYNNGPVQVPVLPDLVATPFTSERTQEDMKAGFSVVTIRMEYWAVNGARVRRFVAKFRGKDRVMQQDFLPR